MEPLCTACIHATPRYAGIVFCAAPKNIVLSKVDGADEYARSAENCRNSNESCGANAAWFEERK